MIASSQFSSKSVSVISAGMCLVFSVEALLLSFGAVQLANGIKGSGQATSGWIALLAAAILLSVEQTRRYHRRKLRNEPVHHSRYSKEFVALAESSQDAVVLLEAERNASGEICDFAFRYLNSNAQQLLGAGGESLPGEVVSAAMPFFASAGLSLKFKSVVMSGMPQTEELAVDDQRVNAKWLRMCATKFDDGVLLTATDLTAQKQLEIQLCQKAHHDLLTGLPNRVLLDDRLQQAIERAKRNRNAAAVMMLDIDHLKRINDSYGRAAGDHVLRVVSMRLRDAVRATDSVFRLGGDEFVILFTDVQAHGPVADFARKIVISLFAPVVWNGNQLDVSASMGVAMYPTAGTTPETLLVQADIEMYRMKRTRSARPVMPPRMAPAEFSNFALSYQN